MAFYELWYWGFSNSILSNVLKIQPAIGVQFTMLKMSWTNWSIRWWNCWISEPTRFMGFPFPNRPKPPFFSRLSKTHIFALFFQTFCPTHIRPSPSFFMEADLAFLFFFPFFSRQNATRSMGFEGRYANWIDELLSYPTQPHLSKFKLSGSTSCIIQNPLVMFL